MLTRQRVATIFNLTYPTLIALSTALSMSLVDLAMVQPLGIHATAAVGLAVFSNGLILAFVAGIAPAVQGLVARRRGQGSTEARCLPLNAGLLAAVVVGVPLTILVQIFTPSFFSLVSSDAAVTKIGIPFLRMLYAGLIAQGLNGAFRGHWTGMEKPRVYMWIVVVLNVLNLFGNFVFIHGRFGAPALGATGAALSTTLSLHVGLILNFVMTYRRYARDGFLRVLPDRVLLKRIFKLGMPATMQDFFFSLGYLVFFWIVGQIGTAELAATNVLARIAMVLGLLAMSLGVASATLVSRTVGEGDLEGAAQWGWDAGKLGVIAISLLGVPLLLFPEQCLSLFLSDPRAVEIAISPLRMTAALMGLGSLMYIFAYTLYTIGDGNRVILISFSTQWLVFLPAAWFVGAYLKYGLFEIWIVQQLYGGLATLLVTAVWMQGRWKRLKI
jgi:MATE family multidrug resistance protein